MADLGLQFTEFLAHTLHFQRTPSLELKAEYSMIGWGHFCVEIYMIPMPVKGYRYIKKSANKLPSLLLLPRQNYKLYVILSWPIPGLFRVEKSASVLSVLLGDCLYQSGH